MKDFAFPIVAVAALVVFMGYLGFLVVYDMGKRDGQWEQTCVQEGGRVHNGACFSKDVLKSVN